MNTQNILSTAFAAALALGLASPVVHAAPAKDKCYGIAKAGANDCASLDGSHSCAGQAKADGVATDWKYVAKGTCKELKGLSMEEAKAKAAMKS